MSQRRPLPYSPVKIQKFKSQVGETTSCSKKKAITEKKFKNSAQSSHIDLSLNFLAIFPL